MKHNQAMLLATLFILLFLGTEQLMAEVNVKDVSVKTRWPWNGLVDIIYSIECNELDDKGNPKDVYVTFTGIDHDREREVKMKTLTGDGARGPVKTGGPYIVSWDMAKDTPSFNSTDFQVKIYATSSSPYLVVNLETWNAYYSIQAPDLTDDTCRTTELWLRPIMPGQFTMGNPSDEVGRWDDAPLHETILTKMFYIGVFECTQKQWRLVMGNNPSYYKGDCRPVERVSYNMIRGTSSTGGAGWPKYGHAVDDTSFMGILRTKTKMVFDLPTEAQWEYACRAGTTTALNSGKNLKSASIDAAMAEVGRYAFNKTDGKGGFSEHTKVGSYKPNAWGLYDMHGNVFEWTLDWYSTDSYYDGVEDPVGTTRTTYYRVVRSGSWELGASHCRSAAHHGVSPSLGSNSTLIEGHDYSYGFRIVYLPED